MTRIALLWGRAASATTLTLALLLAPGSRAEDKKPSPVEAAKIAAQKAATERDAAKKVLDEKSAAAGAEADKAAAAKAATDKIVAEKATAEKVLAEKVAAAKAEADKASAAKAASDKAAADRTAAEKTLADKEAAVKAAQEAILAEEDYAANEALTKATKDKDQAEKTLGERTELARKRANESAAAKSAMERAVAEKSAAEQSLAGRVAAEKSAGEKLAALTAGGSTPPEQLSAAKSDAAKATADRLAAEKTLVEKTTAAKGAMEKAKATADAETKAGSEKAEAEKSLSEKIATIPRTLDQAATARANLLGGLKPLVASAWDYAKARHLLWRAGFGGTPEEVAKLHAMGLHAAVDRLVDFRKLPEPNCPVDVRLPERETPYENRLTESERSKLGNERTSRRFQALAQLRQWWLRRMVETQRPLEEKLALFWHGHFSVAFTKNENPYAMYRQNQLFREYAGANYAGLLRGIAQDPAMITYLDNNVNFKGAGNENLGREILELFSMGEGQGYTEQDLREAARALTGYSYDHWTSQFKLIATRHDESSKTIFGRAGNWGGDDLVDMILQQPSTARFIATKLFRYLVHDIPSPETIDRLAVVLRLTHYELQPMLKNLFLSEEFYSAPAMASHIKSPVELMVGTLRTLGLTEVSYGSVDASLQSMGQTLFEPPSVKGWDGGRDWINASRLLVRYNSVVTLVDQGAVNLVAALERNKLTEPGAIVDDLAKGFLATPLDAAKRTELIQFLGQLPPAAEWAKQRDQLNAKFRAVLATMLSTPEYQLSQHGEPVRPPFSFAGVH